jgi:hypothetical protein
MACMGCLLPPERESEEVAQATTTRARPQHAAARGCDSVAGGGQRRGGRERSAGTPAATCSGSAGLAAPGSCTMQSWRRKAMCVGVAAKAKGGGKPGGGSPLQLETSGPLCEKSTPPLFQPRRFALAAARKGSPFESVAHIAAPPFSGTRVRAETAGCPPWSNQVTFDGSRGRRNRSEVAIRPEAVRRTKETQTALVLSRS